MTMSVGRDADIGALAPGASVALAFDSADALALPVRHNA
jgi:hypothetical protein